MEEVEQFDNISIEELADGTNKLFETLTQGGVHLSYDPSLLQT